VVTSTRISTSRWPRRIAIAVVVLALTIAVAALAFEAWSISSAGRNAHPASIEQPI
jgi:hypothetical protein